MSDHITDPAPHRFVPGFWDDEEFLILTHLAQLGVRDKDADVIVDDIIGQFNAIVPILPIGASDQFYRNFAALICDAVSARQRLFAAQHGRMPGALIGDWPTTPTGFTHPFLIAVARVVSEIEVEAICAEGGKRSN